MLKDFNAQTIKWDKATDRINEIVKANSGDSNGRKLRVQILNNGKVESLAGASLSLAWKTPDEKHKGLDAFTVVDASTGVFEIAYTTGMLSNVGNLSASLVLTTGSGVTESSSFELVVEQSNVDDDSIQSSDSFSALTQALVTVQETNMEVKMARGTYPVLADRLNSSDERQEDHQDYTGAALAGLDAKIDGREFPMVTVENLWKPNDTVSGLLSDTSGNLNEHATFHTSGPIEVVSGVNYTMSTNYKGGLAVPYNVRLVQFDKNGAFVAGDSYFGSGSNFKWITRLDKSTKTVRISLDKEDRQNELVYNIGNEPMGDNVGGIWDGEFWDNVPTPPLRDGTVTFNKLATSVVNKIDDKLEKPKFTEYINLWKPNDTVSGLLSDTSGNLNEHATFRTSGPIKVTGGVNYTVSTKYEGGLAIPYNLRLVQFDEGGNFVAGARYFGNGADWLWTVKLEENTKTVRISIDKEEQQDDLAFVLGDKGIKDVVEGKVWDEGFWETLPAPPLGDDSVTTNKIKDDNVTLSKLAPEVITFIESMASGTPPDNGIISPSPARLIPELREKMGYNYPIYMSDDGADIFYSYGSALRVNQDPMADTYEDIKDFGDENIQAMLYLSNGELLVSVRKANTPGRLWLSNGYVSGGNHSNVTWENVLTGHANTVRWMDRSISTSGPFIVVGDYGDRGIATKVYLSTDFGKTFNETFDLYDHAIANPDDAHIHGVAFDPYYNRIWLVNGDVGNNTIYYSDDFGTSWKMGGGTANTTQLTTIYALKDVVLFGSDGPVNGLHRYVRNGKDKKPNTELALAINDHNFTSHVSQMFYKKPGEGNTLYMSFTVDGSPSAQEQPGFILATVDGHNIYEVFKDPIEYAGSQTGIARCFGPTQSGHVVATINDSVTPWERFIAQKQTWS